MLDRHECQVRLALIFPAMTHPAETRGPMAALSIFTMLYAGAICSDNPKVPMDGVRLRPSAVIWMSDEAQERLSDEDRAEWTSAVTSSTNVARTRVYELHEERWHVPFLPTYADNHRETLRDDVWRKQWVPVGAIRRDNRIHTTSSAPAWAVTESFAALFSPTIHGDELTAAIHEWQTTHFGPGPMLKLHSANAAAHAGDAVVVTFPDGTTRTLAPGLASHIMKGVVESWAPKRLTSPFVLVISEPGAKLVVAEGAQLATLGIDLDVSGVLPDAIVADLGVSPVEFWLIEVVATDGPVTEHRKAELLAWAQNQHVPVGDCRFLSAFQARTQSGFRKRVAELATGSYAWFLDEPSNELAWNELGNI